MAVGLGVKCRLSIACAEVRRHGKNIQGDCRRDNGLSGVDAEVLDVDVRHYLCIGS